VTRVVSGPARCIECRAVWRVVHVMLSQEGCVRCGGDLEAIGDRQDLLELHERERRFAPPFPAVPVVDSVDTAVR
jgi:predicted  nucleic acid-binding Zn-ribbon protein